MPKKIVAPPGIHTALQILRCNHAVDPRAAGIMSSSVYRQCLANSESAFWSPYPLNQRHLRRRIPQNRVRHLCNSLKPANSCRHSTIRMQCNVQHCMEECFRFVVVISEGLHLHVGTTEVANKCCYRKLLLCNSLPTW